MIHFDHIHQHKLTSNEATMTSISFSISSSCYWIPSCFTRVANFKLFNYLKFIYNIVIFYSKLIYRILFSISSMGVFSSHCAIKRKQEGKKEAMMESLLPAKKAFQRSPNQNSSPHSGAEGEKLCLYCLWYCCCRFLTRSSETW